MGKFFLCGVLQTYHLQQFIYHFPARDSSLHTVVDISIKKGSIYGLVGNNGAGKTTFLKILSGLTNADSGSFTLLGEDSEKSFRKFKEIVKIVFCRLLRHFKANAPHRFDVLLSVPGSNLFAERTARPDTEMCAREQAPLLKTRAFIPK